MNAEEALARTGAFARGARLARLLHRSPVRTSHLVERRAERYVLRIDTPFARALALDRRAEFSVQRSAWRAGFAAEPVLFVPATRRAPALLVTRYAPGHAWTAADLRRPARVRRLARLLRELHEARLPGPALDLTGALARYAALAGSVRARRLVDRARALLPDPATVAPVLCHNDAIPANVVGLARTRLIDWEYAGRGDPLFDLAVVTGHHRLGAGVAGRFLAAYFGGPGRIPERPMARAASLYRHVRALWELAARASSSGFHNLKPASGEDP